MAVKNKTGAVAANGQSTSSVTVCQSPDSPRLNRFTAIYEQNEGWWVATLLEIPGVFSQGRTLEEAREYLQDAAVMMMAEYRADARQELQSRKESRGEEGGSVEEEILVPLP